MTAPDERDAQLTEVRVLVRVADRLVDQGYDVRPVLRRIRTVLYPQRVTS